MGIPLINAIYEGNPAIGLYTLPLLIWHPMQLVIGTMLAPKLAAFVERENERLGIAEEGGGREPGAEVLPSTAEPVSEPVASGSVDALAGPGALVNKQPEE